MPSELNYCLQTFFPLVILIIKVATVQILKNVTIGLKIHIVCSANTKNQLHPSHQYLMQQGNGSS